MGQAKQRRVEIDALKATGPKFKSANLYMCGWFYKACQPEGLNLVFTKDNEPAPGFMKTILDSVDECSRHSKSKLLSGDFEEFGNTKTYDDAVAWLKDHTEQGIQQYNLMMYGTPTQPEFTGFVRKTEVDMEDLVKFAICLGDNITTLKDLGEIPNDNENGTHYAYVDAKL